MKTARIALSTGILIAMVLALGAFFAPLPAAAATINCICNNGDKTDAADNASCVSFCGSKGRSGIKTFTPPAGTGSTGGSTQNQAAQLTNPLDQGGGVCATATSAINCVQLIIGNVIKTLLGIVGSLALLMIIWGGFLWLTSAGDATRVKKGQATLVWAAMGIVLIFGAYAITSYAITKLTSGPAKTAGTTSGGGGGGATGCKDDFECPSGQYCEEVTEECAAKRDQSANCNRDNECLSNICSNGSCSNPNAVIWIKGDSCESCPTGKQCGCAAGTSCQDVLAPGSGIPIGKTCQ